MQSGVADIVNANEGEAFPARAQSSVSINFTFLQKLKCKSRGINGSSRGETGVTTYVKVP